jgi:hypothetical protein
LPGNGTTEVTTKLLLAGDSAKQGMARVIAQVGTQAASSSVQVVGPPTLNPSSATLVHGSAELEVFVNNALPADQVALSITGCIAGVTPGILIHNGGKDISGKGLTPLTALDGSKHPIFRVDVLSTAAPGTSITVTCYDAYHQSVTGTYTAQ